MLSKSTGLQIAPLSLTQVRAATLAAAALRSVAPSSAISGRVTLSTGRAAAGIIVGAFRRRLARIEPVTGHVAVAADGTYRLPVEAGALVPADGVLVRVFSDKGAAVAESAVQMFTALPVVINVAISG